MYHAAVYRGTSPVAPATNTSINIIAGQNDIVQNNRYFPNRNLQLLGAYYFSATSLRARIVTPTLLALAPLQISPFDNSAVPVTNGNFAYYGDMPVPIKSTEGIEVDVTSTAAETAVVQLYLGDGNYALARGMHMMVRAVGTATLVANTWTNVPLTFDDTLPAGEYEIQGMYVVSATGYAARLVMPDQYYRPGVPVFAATGARNPWPFLDKRFGPLGRFNTIALPSIEMLATAGDTAETVWFDMVKVR